MFFLLPFHSVFSESFSEHRCYAWAENNGCHQGSTSWHRAQRTDVHCSRVWRPLGYPGTQYFVRYNVMLCMSKMEPRHIWLTSDVSQNRPKLNIWKNCYQWILKSPNLVTLCDAGLADHVHCMLEFYGSKPWTIL